MLAKPQISGALTRLQCCPVGEGAAAVIVASDDAIARLGLEPARAPRVLASVTRTERVYPGAKNFDAELTSETTSLAFEQAGVGPEDLDLIELPRRVRDRGAALRRGDGSLWSRRGAALLARGDTDIGGRSCVSASGGLLAMGHPIGPTGVGQVCEVVRQLRGEAGPRQQPDARIGLTHMVGVGAVCVVHVLSRD